MINTHIDISYKEFIRWFHQSRISESTIFLTIFVMISFSTGKLRKNCFGPIRKVSQSEKNWWKKLVKQIGENT